MAGVELFVGLLIAALPLLGLARRWHVPYPVVLVLGGLVLGFVPGLPRLQLDPDLVLLLFLPPLLYWESVTAPTDEMRANARWIWPLAVGLVIATTCAVAAVVHALVPELGWAASFVLGAVVAPTDEIAAAPVAERLGVPRHVIAIIEGEALLNDAGSLILYTAAVAAAVGGTFVFRVAAAEFVVAALGAAAIGLVAGALAVAAWRVFQDTPLQAVISVVLPFVAYVPAQQFGLSGVLAVVVAGTYVNRRTPLVMTPMARLQMTGFWETGVFLANAVIFILVGLSLHGVISSALASHHGWAPLLIAAFAVNVTIVVVRFAWIFGQAAIGPVSATSAHPGTSWKHLVVTGASGLRGGVSLAAALAIPATVASGAPFPGRNLIVFVTFSVILVTLVGGGLSLPALIAALRIAPDDAEETEIRRAQLAMTRAALAAIERGERDGTLAPEHAAELRTRFATQCRRYAEPQAGDAGRAGTRFAREREIVAEERHALVALRERGEIENAVLRRLQLTLDLEDVYLERFADEAALLGESDEELLSTMPPPLPDRRAAP